MVMIILGLGTDAKLVINNHKNDCCHNLFTVVMM